MNLKNKKVIITGATGGIGNSLVKKFTDSGANVLATGTKEEKLNKLKDQFNTIYIEKFKLEEHKNIESFIDLASSKLGGIDILINNAGITLDSLTIRLSEENWKKVLDINLTASPTVKIFSASLSEISEPNSSSKAITNSTVSRLSAPKSSIKLDSSVTFASSIPK